MHLVCLLALCLSPALAARLPNIVGGNDVPYPGKWPFMASLQPYNYHNCGAALISSTWLITASHCIGSSPSVTTVVLGAHDITTQRQGTPTRIQVQDIIKHPQFQQGPGPFPNDIALVQLASPAMFSENIKPVALPDPSLTDFTRDECYMLGWGWTEHSPSVQNILKEARVDVINNDVCQTRGWDVQSYQVCAHDPGVAGVSLGDSGGPLVCYHDGVWLHVGDPAVCYVHPVHGGCDERFPTVFARTSSFRDWIYQHAAI